MSRDSAKMAYWGGASVNGKCACGMTNSCPDSRFGCNCDKNDNVWREDSGLLTDKTKLPVKQLRFGDTGFGAYGYHTLGKFTALHNTNFQDCASKCRVLCASG